MILRIIFGLLLLAQSQWVIGQNLGFVMTEGQTRVQIPIQICNNLIVVPVVINGRLPLKFILDTGVRTTILTEKAFSDFLHLTYARKYTISGPGGDKLIDAYVANNVSIDMPGIHGEGHAMLVLDQDYLELRSYLGEDVNGVLGYELFSRFIVQIDYDAKILTLMSPDRFKINKNYAEMPISIQDTKPYTTTEVEVNDSTKIKVKLLIDTGASHGLLLDCDSDPILKVPERHLCSIIGRGLGGVINGKIARIREIDLGKYSFHRVIVNFPDKNSYTDTLKHDGKIFRNGSIGGEILSRFTVIFDFPHEKMYLKRNTHFKKEFQYNLSGLTVKAYGERLTNFEVSDVRLNSSAYYADLKVGDRILTFNGQSSSDLTLDQTDGILNSRPGRRVVLEIIRDGKKIRKQFFLASPI